MSETETETEQYLSSQLYTTFNKTKWQRPQRQAPKRRPVHYISPQNTTQLTQPTAIWKECKNLCWLPIVSPRWNSWTSLSILMKHKSCNLYTKTVSHLIPKGFSSKARKNKTNISLSEHFFYLMLRQIKCMFYNTLEFVLLFLPMNCIIVITSSSSSSSGLFTSCQ